MAYGAPRADQPGDGTGHAVTLQQPATDRHHAPGFSKNGKQTKPYYPRPHPEQATAGQPSPQPDRGSVPARRTHREL
jgi:hypothetical protein